MPWVVGHISRPVALLLEKSRPAPITAAGSSTPQSSTHQQKGTTVLMFLPACGTWGTSSTPGVHMCHSLSLTRAGGCDSVMQLHNPEVLREATSTDQHGHVPL